jgi:flagellar biosynthetic protein FliQ
MTPGMTEGAILDVMRQALWVSVIISTPILAAALVVGVIIGLLQALTSVQEMTLTFVPKTAAMVAVFWAAMGFMTTTLVAFFQNDVIARIAGAG